MFFTRKFFCFALFLASLSLAGVATPDSLKAASECAEGTAIAQVNFEGLKHTKPRVVERELLNRSGEPFSQEKFEAEKRRLQDLDLFTEISVSCEGTKLTYHFKEIFRWIPAPAGKKTDRDGLMLGLALANINVLGEDIRLEVQYRTTVDPFFDKNEVAFYASSPYLFGLPLGWNLEFLITNSYDAIRNFPERSLLWDLDLDYEVKEHFSLLGTMALRMISTWGGAVLPEIGAGVALDYRDSKLDTRNGVYFEYMLTHVGGGSNFLVYNDSECEEGKDCSDAGLKGENYWELLTDARAYKTFGRFVTGATALVRLRPGDVKFYDYYYHGGANTFRGHEADSGSLGVHEALLTLEERFVLMERHAASLWGINFFYGVQLVAGLDGSLLWDKGRPGWDNYEGAVYGGIHLVIPALDRIRFEVGYSPDRGEPVFYFGLFDKVTSSRWRSR